MPAIPATITDIEHRTNDIIALRLTPQVPFVFDAGQYLALSAPGMDMRYFSIASAPSRDNILTLHVRNMGRGLSQFLCDDAKPGDHVEINGPFGRMHAEHARGRPVLMIGGGTGVVPMLAIAQDIVRRGLSEDGITLIYGVRMQDDVHCTPELDTLRASGELSLHMAVGPQTPDKILAHLAPKLAGHAVYLSGPDPMLYNLLPALKHHGLQDELLHTDVDLNVLKGAAL